MRFVGTKRDIWFRPHFEDYGCAVSNFRMREPGSSLLNAVEHESLHIHVTWFQPLHNNLEPLALAHMH